jgi:hypothetical protein
MEIQRIKPLVIALDFDGTCVTHEFPKVGKDIGAVSVIKKLINAGHNIILYTMRSNRSIKNKTGDPSVIDATGLFLDDAINWLTDNGIKLYGINENPTQKHWTTSPKAYAQLYIDDAALGIPLMFDSTISSRPFVDWNQVEKMLINNGII